MDVPLVLNDIGIRNGLKGYTGKSSTFSHKTVVDGLSAFFEVSDDRNGMNIDLLLLKMLETSLFRSLITTDSND